MVRQAHHPERSRRIERIFKMARFPKAESRDCCISARLDDDPSRSGQAMVSGLTGGFPAISPARHDVDVVSQRAIPYF
jgi:hypothetical protein